MVSLSIGGVKMNEMHTFKFFILLGCDGILNVECY